MSDDTSASGPDVVRVKSKTTIRAGNVPQNLDDALAALASLRARLAETQEERDRLRAALDVSNHYFRQMHQLVHAALEDQS